MSFELLESKLFCPLCKKIQQLCRVSWLHTWERCNYCLMKLPIGKRDKKVLTI